MLLEVLTAFGYLIFLIEIMIISGIAKENNSFQVVFNLVNPEYKRAGLLLISTVGGILPIPGRVAVSASVLDSIAGTKNRWKFGILDYLATHHYYLWSPLEKTVIIPMAVLGISYMEFLGYLYPLILISIGYIVFYVFFIIKESDIDIKIIKVKDPDLLTPFGLLLGISALVFGVPGWISFGLTLLWFKVRTSTPFSKFNKYINWELVFVMFIVLSIGFYINLYHEVILQYLNHQNILFASITAFGLSWFMGSSGKYAGIAAILISLFGIEYLVWFLTIEFIAYNLSPTHKCIHIGRMYFGTPAKEYFKALIIWQLLMFLYALWYTFPL